MAASHLEASLDRLRPPVQRDNTIEICINPDGQVWGEFQGDHSMRGLGTPLARTEINRKHAGGQDGGKGQAVGTVTDGGDLIIKSVR